MWTARMKHSYSSDDSIAKELAMFQDQFPSKNRIQYPPHTHTVAHMQYKQQDKHITTLDIDSQKFYEFPFFPYSLHWNTLSMWVVYGMLFQDIQSGTLFIFTEIKS